jgi:predicted nucleotide-binding protein
MAESQPNSVFVVHGRDRKRVEFFFQLIRALGVRAIEFETLVASSASAAPYVGDVLARAFAEATAIVVLLTGDDLAHLRPDLLAPGDGPEEKDPTPQPRPNVILEAGMALAMHPNRTIIVEVPPIRRMSDLLGRHLVRFHHGAPAERNSFAARLRTAGCTPDATGNDWLNLEYPR